MEDINWFRFEDKELDFPFYKKNPHIPKWGWIVLFIALFIGLIFTMGSGVISGIASCIILIVPVLYFLKWDYRAIFQKPKVKDIGLAVALFVGYMLYAVVMDLVLPYFGITSSGGAVDESLITLQNMFPLFFSLMGEEFVKFIPFIFFMRVIFKFSNNRKLSVILSVALVMVIFAALHSLNFKMFIYAIFMQGFGSIFEFIGYIKTKNILISYITHLCTDVFIYLVVIFAF